MSTPCSKEKNINTLEINTINMANSINKIETKVDKIDEKISGIIIMLETLPLKHPTKEEYDKQVDDYNFFKNKIDLKIAYAYGVFTVISAIITFLINKYL